MSSKFPSEENLEKNIQLIIKPLSNIIRQKILILLSDGPMNYTDILEILNIESGSFYWHLKKMNLLIKQTYDKRYSLTKIGYKAVEIIKEQPEEEVTTANLSPDWYESIRKFVSSITNSPIILFQQLIISYSIIIFFFIFANILQIGTISIFDDSPIYIIILSILCSSLIIVFSQIFALLLLSRYLGQITFYKFTDIVEVGFKLLQTTTPIFIVGLIMSLLINSQALNNNLIIILLQFILAIISLFLGIILSIAVIDETLEFGFQKSSITVLVVYYPIVILSFLIVSIV
jgi:DNA-binding transcriptional ArsR family regulator